jgi:hypothetical protein
MALRGNAANHGVADVWQLLLQQDSVGVLHVTHQQEHTSITFEHGFVVGIGYQEGEVVRDFDAQARTLCGTKYMDMCQQATVCLMCETVGDMLAWQEGGYHFIPSEEVVRFPAFLHLRADTLLMEAMHRMQVWPPFRKQYASAQNTFYLCVQASQAHTFLEEASQNIAIDPEQWDEGAESKAVYGYAHQVVRCLEEPLSLQALAARCGLWMFEVCMALEILIPQGHVSIAHAPSVTAAPNPWAHVLWKR